LVKKRNIIIFGKMGFSLPSDTRDEDRGMNEEEAENAEIVPGKPLGRFDPPEEGKRRALFPCIPALSIWPFPPLRAPRPLRLSFFIKGFERT